MDVTRQGLHKLKNVESGRVLKAAVSSSRLKDAKIDKRNQLSQVVNTVKLSEDATE